VQGPVGPQGTPGNPGPQGLKGETGTGIAGPAGAIGDPGPQGLKGDKGDTGLTGAKGDKGEATNGIHGVNGINGATGDTGQPGPKGSTGDKGDPGDRGANGSDGAKGARGLKGDTGEQGPIGNNELAPYTFRIAAASDNMSVSIDRFVSGTFDLALWIKLLQLRYNSTTQTCDQFIVGGQNIFDLINSKRDIVTSYSRAEVDTAVATINTKALANTASIATISTKATTNTASISTINSTITTISTNLNTAISGVNALNSTCYLKSISGVNNRLNLDSRFRIYTNTTDTFSIQRLDNDGTIITDAWLDLMKITFDTNTNKTTAVTINGEDILAKMNSTNADPYSVAGPILKVVNLTTGQIGLRFDESYYNNFASPFWCAGMVDGNNLNKLASKGRYGYSVTRAAGYPVGVYTITMDTAYSSAFYVLTSTMQFNGFSKVWETQPPTANTFSIVTQSVTGGIVNGSFHFTMIA
jgi:hypothetical protein